MLSVDTQYAHLFLWFSKIITSKKFTSVIQILSLQRFVFYLPSTNCHFITSGENEKAVPFCKIKYFFYFQQNDQGCPDFRDKSKEEDEREFCACGPPANSRRYKTSSNPLHFQLAHHAALLHSFPDYVSYTQKNHFPCS